MDKNKSVKNFSELNESQLNMVNGGDWWRTFLKKLTPINSVSGIPPKIG